MMQAKIMVVIFILFIAPSVSSVSYNEQEAIEYISYSFASYCQAQNIAQWKVSTISQKYPNMQDIQVVQGYYENVLGYIGYQSKSNTIVVAFRGTTNIINWLNNLTAYHTKYLGSCSGQVHAGFYNTYNGLKNSLLFFAKQYVKKYAGAKFYVTGHSLGGALALLYVTDLYDLGIKVDKLITAGSPRLGDDKYRECIDNIITKNTVIFRLVNEKDMVPHVPTFNMGYVHQNSEIWYTDGGYRICYTQSGEDQTCSYQYSVAQCNTDDHFKYIGISGFDYAC